MKLVVIFAVIACSYAAKLDRTYLPPPGADTSGGSPGTLTAPHGAQTGQGPFGQTSAQGPSATGFGRLSAAHGSSAPSHQESVGSQIGAQGPSNKGFESQRAQGPSSFGSQGQSENAQQNFDQHTGPSNQDTAVGPVGGEAYSQPERAQAAQDRAAEILRYENENDGEKFAYSFETSNGIAAEENGVATNGVQAQGAFSYTGDDGQLYSITYTADENGYQPRGDHLPTPPPIPEAILKSIEENARAAAAGTQEGAYQEDYDQINAPGSAQQYNQGVQNYNSPQQSSKPYNALNAQSSFESTSQDIQASSPLQKGSNRPQFNAPSSSTNQYNAPTSSNKYNIASATNQYNAPNKQFDAPESQYNAPTSDFNQKYTPSSNKFNAPLGQKDAGSHVSAQQRPSTQFDTQTGYQYNRPAAPQGTDSQSSQTTSFGSNAFLKKSQSFPTNKLTSSSGQLLEPSSVQQPSFGSNKQQSNYNAPTLSQQPSFGRQSAGPSQRQQQQPSRAGISSGPISTAQQPSFEPTSAEARPQYNAPNAIQQTSRLGSQQQVSSGRPSLTGDNNLQSGSQIPKNYPGSPYQYNAPKSDSTPRGFARQGSEVARHQQFGGPRQPPSFSPEEGYKY